MGINEKFYRQFGGHVEEAARVRKPYVLLAGENRVLARLVGPLVENTVIPEPPFWGYTMAPIHRETVILAGVHEPPEGRRMVVFRGEVDELRYELLRSAYMNVLRDIAGTRPAVEREPYLFTLVPHAIRVAYRVLVGEGRNRSILFTYQRGVAAGGENRIQLPGDYVLSGESIPQAMRRVLATSGHPTLPTADIAGYGWYPHREEPLVTVRADFHIPDFTTSPSGGRVTSFLCRLRPQLRKEGMRSRSLDRIVCAIELRRKVPHVVSEDVEHAIEEL